MAGSFGPILDFVNTFREPLLLVAGGLLAFLGSLIMEHRRARNELRKAALEHWVGKLFRVEDLASQLYSSFVFPELLSRRKFSRAEVERFLSTAEELEAASTTLLRFRDVARHGSVMASALKARLRTVMEDDPFPYSGRGPFEAHLFYDSDRTFEDAFSQLIVSVDSAIADITGSPPGIRWERSGGLSGLWRSIWRLRKDRSKSDSPVPEDTHAGNPPTPEEPNSTPRRRQSTTEP